MAEEELSPAQKLALASNFVINSPPAQTSNVMDGESLACCAAAAPALGACPAARLPWLLPPWRALRTPPSARSLTQRPHSSATTDVRTLVGSDVLTPDKEAGLLARVNVEKFAAVDCCGKKVLLTPFGELPGGLFLDPDEPCALSVNHKALTATKSDEPVDAATLASMNEPATSAMRSAVDAAMQKYVSGCMPDGVVTTYGATEGVSRITCCIAAQSANLENYWAGRWQSEWVLEVPSGGSIGTLTGKVSVSVHYFEDGNVQLDDKVVFQTEVAVADVGTAFAAKVKEFDTQFYLKLEDIYSGLSEDVLQNLRRRLPITKMKFDWDKLSVSSLAKEMQGLGRS